MSIRSKFNKSRKLILAALVVLIGSIAIGAFILKDRPVRLFDRLPVRSNDIVLFGDSHFEFFNAAEMLGDRSIRNKGYSGQTSRDMLHRIDDIISSRPRKVILCAGANDAFHGRTMDEHVEDMRQLIQKLKGGAKQLAVMAIPPTSDPQLQDAIDAFNIAQHQICAEHGVPFLDITESLTKDGLLDPRLTSDGVHLNDDGYRRIVPHLQPFIDN
jgi:lysophospholipase L1-like esterase